MVYPTIVNCNLKFLWKKNLEESVIDKWNYEESRLTTEGRRIFSVEEKNPVATSLNFKLNSLNMGLSKKQQNKPRREIWIVA